MGDLFDEYLKAVRGKFFKLCRLRFLNSDGTTAFAVDNSEKNKYSGSFIANGSISVNLQNGQRRTATIEFAKTDEDFEYKVGKLWFGQELALDEGLILPDGTEFYIQQGVFVLANPEKSTKPFSKTITYTLVDKWANLDGTLYGKLESTYEVALGTNIFQPIASLLAEDRGNGIPVDGTQPVFTIYYNDKTQTLPDGTIASLAAAPYTLTVDDGSKADVILGLAAMVNGVVGYNSAGALTIEPSQDDVDYSSKPIDWSFSSREIQLLNVTEKLKPEEVYNDYIVVGDELDDYSQPKGRAQNFDPASNTNINLIGRKTIKETASGYATDTQCRDLAAWKLKRAAILNSSIDIDCAQILHIRENSLVEIIDDEDETKVERYLIQGFVRNLAGTGGMTITAVSVKSIPDLTIS